MKKDRFEHLEAPRTETPTEVPRVSSRFAAVDASPTEQLERRDEGRKQLRCAECGRENGRYAGTCTKCGVSLDTRATRRLNERLFQDERQQQRVDQVMEAVVEEAHAPPDWRRWAVIGAIALALILLFLRIK